MPSVFTPRFDLRLPLVVVAGATTLAINSVSLPAQAKTITFDSLTTTSNTFVPVGTTYSEQGFTLTDNSGQPSGINYGLATWGSSSSNYTGSQSLFNNGIGQTTTLTKDGGGVFSLNSIDLSELFNNGSGDVTVSFTGVLLGGGSVVQSFTTDGVFGAQTFTFDSSFANLTSVTWGQNTPFSQFDNIVVDTPEVPEPSLLPGLLGLGIAGGAIVAIRRRTSRQTANS